MFFNTPQHYTFSTGGFGITLNALGTDQTGRNYTQCYVVSGAKLYVYIDDKDEDLHIFQERDMGGVEGESDAIKANHYAAPYDILCYPTHFTNNARRYVYAAIPRSKTAVQVAIIVYPSQRIDVLGRIESTNEAGETAEQQLGDPDYYYIDLQGRITSADNEERHWEFEIMQGAILGHIIGDEAGGTRAEQNSLEQMYQDLLAQLNAINFFEKVEMAPEEAIYEVDEVTGERILNEDGEPIPVMVQKTDKNGRPLYRGEDGKETTTETDEPVMIPLKVQHDAVRLKPKYEGLFAEGWISALGINKDGAFGGGACDIDIIPDEDFDGELDAPTFGITPKITELIDVIVTDLQDGETLVWDTSVNGGSWVNKKGGGSLSKGDVLGTLWGNVFKAGDNLTNSIKLGDDKSIIFGNSGERIYCIEDDPNVIVITAPVQIGGGPLIEWDATNKAYHFHGAIYSDSFISALGINNSAGGTGGGGGTDVKWGSYLRDRKVRELNVGGDIENVLLEGALDSFNPSVSWSDIKGTTPIWNQDTTGNAATATKLKTPVTLWGNSFDGSQSIGVSGNNASLQYVNNITASGNFTLNGVTVQTGNYFQLKTYYSQIIFGTSGENGDKTDLWRLGPNAHRTVGDDFDGTFCFWFDNQDYMRLGKVAGKKTVFIHKDVCLRIGDGEILWDADNDAFHFTRAIYSESWISSLGVNNAIIEQLKVKTINAGMLTSSNGITIGQNAASDAKAGRLTLCSGTDPDDGLSDALIEAYLNDSDNTSLRVGNISEFAPKTGNNIDLGEQSLRWNTVYTNSVSFRDSSGETTLTAAQVRRLKQLI